MSPFVGRDGEKRRAELVLAPRGGQAVTVTPNGTARPRPTRRAGRGTIGGCGSPHAWSPRLPKDGAANVRFDTSGPHTVHMPSVRRHALPRRAWVVCDDGPVQVRRLVSRPVLVAAAAGTGSVLGAVGGSVAAAAYF